MREETKKFIKHLVEEVSKEKEGKGAIMRDETRELLAA